MGVLHSLAAQAAVFLALLLLASGSHKVLRRAHFRTVVREFAGVPGRFAPFTVAAAAGLEWLAALGLCTASWRVAGAALAVLILSAYLLLILRAIDDGRHADCGCSFGPAQSSVGQSSAGQSSAGQSSVGPYHTARNVALVGMALMVLALSTAGGATPVLASQVAAGFTLLAVYAALDQVMTLQPLRPGAVL